MHKGQGQIGLTDMKSLQRQEMLISLQKRCCASRFILDRMLSHFHSAQELFEERSSQLYITDSSQLF